MANNITPPSRINQLAQLIVAAQEPRKGEPGQYLSLSETKEIVALASQLRLHPRARKMVGELVRGASPTLDAFVDGNPVIRPAPGKIWVEGRGVRDGLIGATKLLNTFAVKENLEQGPKHLGDVDFAHEPKLLATPFNVERAFELSFAECSTLGYDKASDSYPGVGVQSWTPPEALIRSTTQQGSFIAKNAKRGPRVLTCLKVSKDAVPGTLIKVLTARGFELQIRVT